MSASRPLPTGPDFAPRAVPPGALGLAVAAAELGAEGPLILACEAEEEAERLVASLKVLLPGRPVIDLPAWSVPLHDDAEPDAASMGRRIAAVLALEEAEDPILVTTAAALAQRVPPADHLSDKRVTVRAGEALDTGALRERLLAFGYRVEERADDPGEVAFQGERIDLFPAQGSRPVRITTADGTATGIACVDPLTLHTTDEEVDEVTALPATELAALKARDADTPLRALGRLLPAMPSVPELMPGAALLLSPGCGARLEAALRANAEAAKARSDGHELGLSGASWAAALAERDLHQAAQDEAAEAVPRFAGDAHPRAALRRFVAKQREAGRRVVLAGTGHNAERLAKAARKEPAACEGWRAVTDAEPGTLLTLPIDPEAGLILPDRAVVIVAPRDLLGSRADREGAGRSLADTLRPPPLSFGDAVVHTGRGIAELVALEEAMGDEVIRLRFAGGDEVLVPAGEAPRLWRYGPDPSSAPLSEADADFAAERDAMEAEIARTAAGIAEQAEARAEAEAAIIKLDRAAYERFAAGFAHALTPDQAAATSAVLEDLASGRPMDRLVVGDVGYGKTEVALRAAAAAVTAGYQVAVCAPTTVLCRQHTETFTDRFACLDAEVAQLSRLTTKGEAEEVRRRLADGEIDLVVGTHALKDTRFARLGLVVIDEEQRFGAADKAALCALDEDVHVLTLTATPIPRTLAAAEAGLIDASVIATPPVRRQPVRTERGALTDDLLRAALTRERRRGGQSFVVCPRIEDMDALRERTEAAAPKLAVMVAHGKLPAAEVDEVMVRFARGEGDVLLSTSIIESGLDVPRANTMIVANADRFGLAQLHQLRGRVGRGAVRGTVHLTTQGEITDDAEARLAALTQSTHLGAGFDVSAQDLDQRGAGDLLGEEQAGHVAKLGLELYRHLLGRALAAERGEPAPPEAPGIGACATGHLATGYVTEPISRLRLYARLGRADTRHEIDALEEETTDRFGPLPDEARALLDAAQLRGLCRRARVAEVDAGPKAIALTFTEAGKADEAMAARVEAAGERFGAPRWSEGRLIFANDEGDDPCVLAHDVVEVLAGEDR